MTFWFVAAAAVSLLVVLYMDGRRRELAVERDWRLLLTSRGEQAYLKARESLSEQLELADVLFDQAFATRQLDSMERTTQLLVTGYGMIADFSPSFGRFLSGMAIFSRMVSAMAPLPPLRPAAFRLRHVAGLARLQAFLHHLLVTTHERFRWRLFVIGHGFQYATRFLFGATRRAAAAPAADRAWGEIQAARHDVHALKDESLESFRALLVSLAAQRRPVALPLP